MDMILVTIHSSRIDTTRIRMDIDMILVTIHSSCIDTTRITRVDLTLKQVKWVWKGHAAMDNTSGTKGYMMSSRP